MISSPALVMWHVPRSYAVRRPGLPIYICADLTTSNNDANGHVKLYIMIIVFRGFSRWSRCYRFQAGIGHRPRGRRGSLRLVIHKPIFQLIQIYLLYVKLSVESIYTCVIASCIVRAVVIHFVCESNRFCRFIA